MNALRYHAHHVWAHKIRHQPQSLCKCLSPKYIKRLREDIKNGRVHAVHLDERYLLRNQTQQEKGNMK